MSVLSFPVIENEPLQRHTSWRIGGAARYFAQPNSVAQLQELADYLRASKEPFAFLGNGSNLLVPDEGFAGWIINTNQLPGTIDFRQGDRVVAGAGVLNAKVVRTCANQGLGGLGFLAGVPGTIGGAVVMNAGIGSACVADVIISCRTFCFASGEKNYQKNDMHFVYRQQNFMKPTELVLEAEFQLEKRAVLDLKQELGASAKYRKQAQPIDQPSCGSVFRNPDGAQAWQLIDAAGLRGFRIGDAQISEKHTNFIVNLGAAKMTDVVKLIELIKEKVKATSGIELEEEVKILDPVRSLA